MTPSATRPGPRLDRVPGVHVGRLPASQPRLERRPARRARGRARCWSPAPARGSARRLADGWPAPAPASTWWRATPSAARRRSSASPEARRSGIEAGCGSSSSAATSPTSTRCAASPPTLAPRAQLHGLSTTPACCRGPRAQPQGHELAFATNVLGPFLLTNLLLLAARGGPSRVVSPRPAACTRRASTRRSRARAARVRRRARVRAHEADRGDPRRAVGGARARERRLVRVVSPRLGRHPRARVVAAPVPPAAATAASRPRHRAPTPRCGCCATAASEQPPGAFWHDRRPRPPHRVPVDPRVEAERHRLWNELARITGWSEDEKGGR